MLLSTLAEKELIEMAQGVRYGFLQETECIFHPQTGKIIAFELPTKARPFSKKKPLTPHYIAWESIQIIGDDRILFKQTTNSIDMT